MIASLSSRWLVGDSQPAPWKIIRARDELSDKIITHAETSAATQFTQRGEAISAKLVVYCMGLLKGDPGEFAAQVWFSRPVAVGRTWGRVRIDDGPVQAIHPDSYSSGQAISVFFPRDDGLTPLFGSRRLRVEYDLPFAGRVILAFPTSGAPSHLADQLHAPCVPVNLNFLLSDR